MNDPHPGHAGSGSGTPSNSLSGCVSEAGQIRIPACAPVRAPSLNTGHKLAPGASFESILIGKEFFNFENFSKIANILRQICAWTDMCLGLIEF
jgi:hypothetical protein